MNNKTFAVLSTSALIAALAVPLVAQSMRLTANIPFEFIVAGKTLPAGEYSIATDSSTNALMIQGFAEHVSALCPTNSVAAKGTDPAAGTKLVFNRYGDKYFLSEALNGYLASGRQVVMSRAEREFARTASASAPETVTVLASLR